MSDTIIWMLLFFIFIIIIGLYLSDSTPLDLTEKENILNESIENFAPAISTSVDQSEGTSELYGWDVPENKNYTEPPPACETPPPPKRCTVTPPSCPEQSCVPRPNVNNLNDVCNRCDITVNKDIDKYVLKSSVPACPDTSKYITKNMMNSNPDLNDYILKSEIKPCDKIDISKYILKSEIPSCPQCPVCPECPICPVCPKIPAPKKCKQIHEYDIREHPDFPKYSNGNQNNQNNQNNKNNQIQEECNYTRYINDIYEEGHQVSNQETGMYVGDNLYAGFGNNSKSTSLTGYYAGDSAFLKV